MASRNLLDQHRAPKQYAYGVRCATCLHVGNMEICYQEVPPGVSKHMLTMQNEPAQYLIMGMCEHCGSTTRILRR
jgi:hypothetical protein